jgi:Ni/Fe-hydrogenase subunit HybB-like protein
MRKWGIVISVFYAMIVLGLLVPAAIIIAGDTNPLRAALADFFSAWLSWILIAAVVAGQVLLLFLSVDSSQKRLKPRTHIAISVAVSSMLFGLLSLAVIYCVGVVIRSDEFGTGYLDTAAKFAGAWVALWVLWGVFFYLYLRNSTHAVTHVISWLLKGSVLELLIAVPCHVIVRRRGDCSAPAATSFGIATGIAVMLLCFGPSVLFLFKKRLDAYSAHKPA